MSMNKAIHQAFRRDLGRFLRALDAFTEGDATQAARLGRAWDNFDFQLTKHHEGEHEIAWPALTQVGVGQDVIDQMDAEHHVMAERLAATRAAMAAFRAAATQANAQAARQVMAELQTVTTEHLDHEEEVLEPVFAARHDDPAIKAMGKQFAKVGPQEGGVFFAWVLDGADAETSASIRSTVPGPVLAVLTTVFGRSYRKDVVPAWG
jgi:hypothetical protein